MQAICDAPLRLSAPHTFAQQQHSTHDNPGDTGQKIQHRIVAIATGQDFGQLLDRGIGCAPCKEQQHPAKNKCDKTDDARGGHSVSFQGTAHDRIVYSGMGWLRDTGFYAAGTYLDQFLRDHITVFLNGCGQAVRETGSAPVPADPTRPAPLLR